MRRPPHRPVALALLLALLPAARSAHAQDAADPAPQPLPDVATLMREVEVHQRQAEAVQKDYIFREDSIGNELNRSGEVKKTEERAFDIFWIDSVRVARTVRKDGKDLSADELAKENQRIDKEVAKAKERRAKADASGKETDSEGRDEITLSRILELGSFSNPRRVEVNGRPTIAIDYTGDPHARTHNPGEAAMKMLTGTVWVDEQDKSIQHLEAHFFDDFKLGAGLVADIKKGTSFQLTNVRINNEVWLPSSLDAQGQARYLLFFSLNGNAHVRCQDYRKFRATSTILPNFTKAPEDAAPATNPPAAPPPPN
jgi:hypothetical protein